MKKTMTEQEKWTKVVKEASSLDGKLYARDQLRKLRMVRTIAEDDLPEAMRGAIPMGSIEDYEVVDEHELPHYKNHRVYNKPLLEIKWWLQEKGVDKWLQEHEDAWWALAGVLLGFLFAVAFAYFNGGI